MKQTNAGFWYNKKNAEDRGFLFRALIVLICFFTTFILIQNTTGTAGTKILQPLNNFPEKLGNWKLVNSRKSGEGVIKLLGVNDYIDYIYQDRKGNQINLYVGFYESVGTKGGYHSPKNCLPGSGWGIDKTKTVTINLDRQLPVEPKTHANVSEMVIRNGSQYQVVLYWFQNRGRIITSEYSEKIYLIIDALLKKRRDGSFVRLMTHASSDSLKKAESLLIDFSQLAIPQLDNFIPGKDLTAL